MDVTVKVELGRLDVHVYIHQGPEVDASTLERLKAVEQKIDQATADIRQATQPTTSGITQP